ncbi:MAG: ABC transporter permease [Flavisolibacter sp.]|jgi:ABC-type transport system involved in multi-copper enzyme maturation permease subunit|nr:ABC transporter permease [Flavisolibacter sp.]
MTNLIYTEWLKMRKYRAFWWMAAIVALSYPGINYIFFQIFQNLMSKGNSTSDIMKMLVGNPFTFPEIWHTVAYASSIFIFIPSIVVIMFITNEYTYKTHRQNVIDGWSRNQFMTSKLIDVLIVSILVTLLYVIVALVIGFVNKDENPTANIWEQSYYIGLFGLQAFSQLSIAFFIAFLARKAFVALGIFLFYFIILEPVAVGFSKVYANDIGKFMPLEISDRLIPVPAFLGKFDEEGYRNSIEAVNMHVVYSIVLIVIIWGACYLINKRRDF